MEDEQVTMGIDLNDTRLAAYDQLLSAYASFMAGDVTTAGDALANVKSEYLSNVLQTIR